MKKAESQNVEYKRSWHDEYLKWVCGFANAKGGTIWIGIDDDKSVCGVEKSKKLMEDIPNKIKDTMGLVVSVSLLKKQKKDVLRIDVPESDFPVAYHGEYHFRSGSTKQQLTGFALTQFLFHKMHLSWDAVETAGRLAFKDYRFKQFKLRYAKKAGREFKDGWFVSTGFRTKDGVLTNAGALFADECPIPQSRVFCTVWNGLTKSKDSSNDQEYSGSLIELLDAAEKFIKLNTKRGWKKRPTDRVNYPDYPERAVTEALVNALVHRDYTIYGSEVHVDIYPDRLEIVSPGGMPDGSAVQDLDWRSVASDRRNPTLADMFAQMDYMERKGSGLGLMLDAYAKEVPNPRQLEPKFYSSSGSFHVVLPNLNFNVTQGVTQDDTQGVTQGVPQGGTQDGTQDGTQGGIQELARDMVTRILGNPKITAKELSIALGVPLRTLRRHLAKLPNVRYVGHGYSGHWEVD